jgi:hypothetical protein
LQNRSTFITKWTDFAKNSKSGPISELDFKRELILQLSLIIKGKIVLSNQYKKVLNNKGHLPEKQLFPLQKALRHSSENKALLLVH